MIENRKVYNIKIYNDELNLIIAALLERIRELTLSLGEENDDVKKSFIRTNIQNYRNIITRLDTGVIYNENKSNIDTPLQQFWKNIQKWIVLI